MPVNAKLIVGGFCDRYEEKHGKPYYINTWHAILAGKIAQYYSAGKINKALDFYFSKYSSHDLKEFLEKIDDFSNEVDKQSKFNKELTKLISETKRRMKKFYGNGYGSSSNNKNSGDKGFTSGN